ncbi:MAG: hypothetical protein LBG07_07550 [Treponema sp.]|nr:hypothetical protein [Treponema sp.]
MTEDREAGWRRGTGSEAAATSPHKFLGPVVPELFGDNSILSRLPWVE